MKKLLETTVLEILKAKGLPQVDFVIEHPKDVTHGDYACNVAMVLAKKVGKPPRELATELATALADTIEYVTDVSVAGPGFLNFSLHRDFFSREVVRIKEEGGDWGVNQKLDGKKVLIEKSAPNLYKPFHVGHLLNLTISESISRLYRMNGATVTDVSYPSDISLGVAKAVWALLEYNGDPTDIKELGNAYVQGTKAYEESDVVKSAVQEINTNLNTGKNGPSWDIYLKGRKTSLDYFHTITKRLGSSFDDSFYESEAGVRGKKIVEEKVGEVFQVSDGAIVFLGEEYGLHTRVFVTGGGIPVYEAKDIGLIAMKFERFDPDVSILYTDVEQKHYFEVIKKVAELTFGEWGEKTHYLQHGRLRFADKKVSSRLGNVPLAEDLIETVKEAVVERMKENAIDSGSISDATAEAVAQSALKYTFLKAGPGQNITFDLKQALSFEGDSGPYLQYTHARIVSVLEKAECVGVLSSVELVPDNPYEVERLVCRFPEVVEVALAERAPQYMSTYLIQLSGAFNAFYAKEKIADPNDRFAPYKVAVSDAVRITLKNGLWVLGIEAPEKM